MLRLIVKVGNSFKTYDFECSKLQEEYRNGDLIGIEVLCTGIPRLISTPPESKKIAMIKAIRQYTNWSLKESKEFIESVPVDLPQIEPNLLVRLVNDLRDAGALVEA